MSKSTGYFCLLFICIVWGTTYLVMRIAVQTFPPVLFAAIRNTSGGLMLLAALSFTKLKFHWTWKNILRQFVAGFLLIFMGNGLVSWSVQYVPSGLTALLCALTPLNIVVLSLLTGKENKMNVMVVVGIILGLIGMAFIFRDNIKDLANPQYLSGILVILLATIGWSLGTLFTRKNSGSTNVFHNSALQMLAGGLILMIASLFTGDWHRMGAVGNESLIALVYLTLIGSVAAFVAYQIALSTLPVGLATIYAYVNPLIAVILGYFILDERFTWFTVLAFIFTITGVYLVNTGYKLKKKNVQQPITDH